MISKYCGPIFFFQEKIERDTLQTTQRLGWETCCQKGQWFSWIPISRKLLQHLHPPENQQVLASENGQKGSPKRTWLTFQPLIWRSYGWWKKSCTSWYTKYLIIYKVVFPSQVVIAGFLNHQKHVSKQITAYPQNTPRAIPRSPTMKGIPAYSLLVKVARGVFQFGVLKQP